MSNCNIKYGIMSVLALLFISCFEKDEPVSPYQGEVVTITSNVNHYQSYFDFETGEVKASNPIADWQLGFESNREGWHILVNSGAGWFIRNTYQKELDAPLPGNEPQDWRYDIQSAYPDSTATGNWTSFQNNVRAYTNDVYILGELSAGTHIHRKRIQFLYVDSISYRFCFFDEETELLDTVTISKLDSVTFVYYSFIGQEQMNLEPSFTQYDILFTTYYDLATQFGVTIPYLVRGVLLNIAGTLAVIDSVNSYSRIDYELVDQYQFSGRRDVIGYRWKDVNVNTGEGQADYTVRHNYTYVIKTMEGNFYKMRFLSFSLNGESGFPQFEIKLLRPVQ